MQIAIVFDFAGAMLLGRVVTANDVADMNSFSANPEVYAYGMICACTAGTFWLAVASRMGVNVSGTHFISMPIAPSIHRLKINRIRNLESQILHSTAQFCAEHYVPE